MRKITKDNRGQGMIEATISLVLIFLLLGGIVNIWMWGNRQIVERQLRYNASRVKAGTSSDSYDYQWGAKIYMPPELSEDDVILASPLLNGQR